MRTGAEPAQVFVLDGAVEGIRRRLESSGGIGEGGVINGLQAFGFGAGGVAKVFVGAEQGFKLRMHFRGSNGPATRRLAAASSGC